MKALASAALVLGILVATAAAPVLADRGHGRVHSHVGVGIVLDPFWFGPGYYPPPYYYPPYYYPPMVAAPAPPVYIEREAPSDSGYWYYCAKPQGYYPYVKRCPGGWQPVPPEPEEDEGR